MSKYTMKTQHSEYNNRESHMILGERQVENVEWETKGRLRCEWKQDGFPEKVIIDSNL